MDDITQATDPLAASHELSLPKPEPPAGAIVNSRGGWILPRKRGQTFSRNPASRTPQNLNKIVAKMRKGRMTHDDLMKMARPGGDPDPTMVVAAKIILEAEARADPADFEKVISGMMTLDELRATGVDTSVVKKLRMRSKTGLSGDTEEIVELELKDTGEAIDRFLDRTIGKARTTAEVTLHTPDQVPTLDLSNLSPSELETMLKLAEKAQTVPAPEQPQDAQAVVTNPQIPRQQIIDSEEVLVDIPEERPAPPRPAPLRTYEFQIPMPVVPTGNSQKESVISRMLRQYGSIPQPSQE